MPRFIWANGQQIINVDSIVIIAVDDEGDTGVAHLTGYPNPVQLRGKGAAELLSEFVKTRPSEKPLSGGWPERS